MTLYLIGIDHRDIFNGPKKLEKMLEEIKPDMIFYEGSKKQMEEKIQYAQWRLPSAAKKRSMGGESQEILEGLESLIVPWTTKTIDKYARMAGASTEFGFRSYEAESGSWMHMVEAGSLFFTYDFSFGKPGKRVNGTDESQASMYYLKLDLLEDQIREYIDIGLQEQWNKYTKIERSLKGEAYLLFQGSCGESKEMEKAIRDAYQGHWHDISSIVKSSSSSSITL